MASPALLQEPSTEKTLETTTGTGPLNADGDILYADSAGRERDEFSHRARVVQWIALRAKGLTNKEIATALGIAPRSLNNAIYRANKAGWLKYNNPTERFENEIIPKVVDNIDHWINLKDKTMTIEAAKGAGIFKSHQAVKVEGDAPQTVLALKIETMEGGEAKILTGHVVGRAREIEEE